MLRAHTAHGARCAILPFQELYHNTILSELTEIRNGQKSRLDLNIHTLVRTSIHYSYAQYITHGSYVTTTILLHSKDGPPLLLLPLFATPRLHSLHGSF